MKFQDIQLSDVGLRREFINYFLNGQYQQALSFLNAEANKQLDTKKFVEDTLNIINVILLQLEQYYYDAVPNYLQMELERYNTLVDQFRKRDVWDSTVSYKKHNFVLYQDLIYYCKADAPAGAVPNAASSPYWVLLGLKGETGKNSIGTQLKYQWSSSTTYQPKDVVIVGNTMYVALKAGSGNNPQTAIDYWEVLIKIPKISILISAETPVTPFEGMIWFQIMN